MNNAKRIGFPLSALILLIFAALLVAYDIYEFAPKGANANVPGVICFFIGAAVAGALGVKNFVRYARARSTLKNGEDGVCHITNYTSGDFGGSSSHHRASHNRFYSLTLRYEADGVIKTYKTRYDFSINEFRYLRKLREIKMKRKGGFLVVTEEFPDEIYKVINGVDRVFLQEKPFKTILKVWRIFALIGFLTTVVGAVLTFTYRSVMFIGIGAGIFIIPNLICGIIWGIAVFSHKF